MYGGLDVYKRQILEYPFDENDEWKYQVKVGNQYYLLPIQSVELHVYRHGVGILFIQMSNCLLYTSRCV